MVTPKVLDPLGLCSSSGLGASLMVDRFLGGCSTHWANGMPKTGWCGWEDEVAEEDAVVVLVPTDEVF